MGEPAVRPIIRGQTANNLYKFEKHGIDESVEKQRRYADDICVYDASGNETRAMGRAIGEEEYH